MLKLFAGLGNPGDKYKNTRHNLGFMALDSIAKAKNLEFKVWGNMADISFYDSENGKVLLVKPMTFMNNSGSPIVSVMNYYKIKSDEICVFYDDFAIPAGEYRIKMTGSAGGHNGISSIINHLHTNNFVRMKLGIGPLPQFVKTPDFVLSSFYKEDENKIKEMTDKAVVFFDEANKAGIEKAISKMSLK